MRAIILAVSLLTFAGFAQADWRKDLKDAAKQQAGAKVDQQLGLPYPPPAGSSVYFINLKEGATVTSPVLVQFGLKKAGVSPPGTQIEGTGHHHLLVDDPQVNFAIALPTTDSKVKHFDKGETETTLTLAPGKHTLQLVFADWKQQSFNPALQSDKITITVSSGTAAAPAPAATPAPATR